MKREFSTYIRLRQRYLQQRKPHMRTIMLDVPPDARSNAILESYFGYLYPGSVLTAACTQVLSDLTPYMKKMVFDAAKYLMQVWICTSVHPVVPCAT